MNELFKDLFIFEMANNHQGSLDHGLTIVREMAAVAKRHKLKASVKFQYRDLETLIHPAARDRSDIPHVPRFLSTRLSRTDYQIMVHAVRDEGLIPMCTPFDETSVGVAVDHGIDVLKVASCSANDWPLLEAIAKEGKPVICSTGGRSLDDIDNIVSFFTHRNVDFALLHCIGLYPVPRSEVQMHFMARMKKRYPGIAVGWSGHENPADLDVVKIAIAKGATILERHVGVATPEIQLNAYSSTPQQVDAWVEAAIFAKEICGEELIDKRVTDGEVNSLLSLARGTYLLSDIKAGATVGRQDVFFAMPCGEGQTASGDYRETMLASRDYSAQQALMEMRTDDPIRIMRMVVHEAKGILCEAGIAIGTEYEVELSHHYGMNQFRKYGAVIVSFINREYCKKLIIMLPGQKHPPHQHKAKEETFQVLYGDMELELEGVTRVMKPGDMQLVRRGEAHAFSTRTGLVFEEVSTTHVRGDSYYGESRIAQLDPAQRKTVIDSF